MRAKIRTHHKSINIYLLNARAGISKLINMQREDKKEY